ncbi:hypothetical protein L1987_13438 [Smallanthus sonchifolius]|uniref:Uncharacterized protein n=1 Tax=Smallanthus sonchifolius TaxID=185202 RepID=A0ACB9JK09_9ASTR|nr:hypothetical protein L1987_13438 [Smallanthus sonchifolius]
MLGVTPFAKEAGRHPCLLKKRVMAIKESVVFLNLEESKNVIATAATWPHLIGRWITRPIIDHSPNPLWILAGIWQQSFP